jgi:hypothetical protein
MPSKTHFEQVSLAEVRKIVEKQVHLRKREAAQALVYKHPAEKDFFLKPAAAKVVFP